MTQASLKHVDKIWKGKRKRKKKKRKTCKILHQKVPEQTRGVRDSSEQGILSGCSVWGPVQTGRKTGIFFCDCIPFGRLCFMTFKYIHLFNFYNI